jgi:hypothetical protein
LKRRNVRRRRILVGLVLAVALVAGGLALAVSTGLLLHDTSTPVSIAQVVAQFHRRGTAAGARDGVYVYVTQGSESVDALGGTKHRYPPRTSITSVGVRCGVRLRWEPLEERSATWTFCTTPRGVELLGFQVSHRFFAQGDTTTYECAGSVLLPAREPAGATSPFHCRSSHGRETGDARVVGFQTVSVAAKPLSAVHVRTTANVSGGDHGTEITDWWFDVRNGLALRIDLESRTGRDLPIVGTVHYREDASLHLLSTRPLR